MHSTKANGDEKCFFEWTHSKFLKRSWMRDFRWWCMKIQKICLTPALPIPCICIDRPPPAINHFTYELSYPVIIDAVCEEMVQLLQYTIILCFWEEFVLHGFFMKDEGFLKWTGYIYQLRWLWSVIAWRGWGLIMIELVCKSLVYTVN